MAEINALLQLLRDRDLWKRMKAAEDLGQIPEPPPEVVSALFLVVEEGPEEVTKVAARALRQLGQLQELCRIAREDEEWRRRATAVKAFGWLRPPPPEVVTAVMSALKDTQWQVRARAAVAVGRLGLRTREILDQLLRSSKDDPHQEVRRRTEEAVVLLVSALVKPKIRKALRFLEQSIEGFPALDPDADLGYALNVTALLIHGLCRERQHCQAQEDICREDHHMAKWLASEQSLDRLVYRAVIGRYGLAANSFAKGMLYPFVRDDNKLLVAPTEWMRCAHCGHSYEGGTCTKEDRTPFDLTTTKVVDRDWLVIEGPYVPLERWRCPGQCRNLYHVSLDGCPWNGCPSGKPPHGDRKTTVWVRKEFAGASPAGPPALASPLQGFWEGIAEAIGTVLERIHGWRRVVLFFLARENVQEKPRNGRWNAILAGGNQLTEDELIKLAETVLWHVWERRRADGPEALSLDEIRDQMETHAQEIANGLGLPPYQAPRTAQAIRQVLRDEILPALRQEGQRALQARGIDAEMIEDWLSEAEDFETKGREALADDHKPSDS